MNRLILTVAMLLVVSNANATIPPSLKDSYTGGAEVIGNDFIVWAFNDLYKSDSVHVQINIAGTYDANGNYTPSNGESLTVGYFVTQITRSDINAQYNISGAHGLTWAIPANYLDGKVRRVEFVAYIPPNKAPIKLFTTMDKVKFPLAGPPKPQVCKPMIICE